MKSVYLLLASLLFFWATPAVAARAPIQVGAQVDRTTIFAGETLQLTVTIEGGQGEVDTSTVKDFKVVPQGSSTQVQILNGRAERRTAFVYTLIATEAERRKLTIPALAVTVAGKVHWTAKIVIGVERAPVPDKDAEAGTDAADVWVTAEVSTRTPFAGQQVIYTITLFNAVQVAEARLQPPAFEGFSAREIEKRHAPNRVVAGREVAVAYIDYLLVPQAAGAYTISPATIQAGVVQPGAARRQTPFDNFFDNPFLERRTLTPRVVSTRPLTVEVRPLPRYSGTLPFTGLVGRFELEGRVDNQEPKAGDPILLVVTLQGEGDIIQARLPELDLPAGLQVYADRPQMEIGTNANGYVGRKAFRIVLVPARPGSYRLPEVKWVYFDVEKKVYRTLSAVLPVVRVRPAEADHDKDLLVRGRVFRGAGGVAEQRSLPDPPRAG